MKFWKSDRNKDDDLIINNLIILYTVKIMLKQNLNFFVLKSDTIFRTTNNLGQGTIYARQKNKNNQYLRFLSAK